MSKRNHDIKHKRSRFTPVCRNCGARVASDFCPDCGQKITAGNEKTVWRLIANAADSLFSWDSKIFMTLKYLLFYPGRLTKNYYDGRIARYVYPTKLFWFLTIVFFAIIIIPSLDRTEDESEKVAVQVIAETADSDSSDGDAEQNTNISVSLEILGLIKSYLPYTVFLLIPFFALLLYIFFFKHRRYYADHIIFALHFHSFIFVMTLLLSIVKKLLPLDISYISALYISVLPVLYFVFALHNAYGASYKRLILVLPAIMLLYLVAIFVITLCFILLMIWIKDPSLFS